MAMGIIGSIVVVLPPPAITNTAAIIAHFHCGTQRLFALPNHVQDVRIKRIYPCVGIPLGGQLLLRELLRFGC